jgi:hypothetical protein
LCGPVASVDIKLLHHGHLLSVINLEFQVFRKIKLAEEQNFPMRPERTETEILPRGSFLLFVMASHPKISGSSRREFNLLLHLSNAIFQSFFPFFIFYLFEMEIH